MEITQIRKEIAEKIKDLDPIGKKLKFKLDDDIVVIDGTVGDNVLREEDMDADCTIIMSKETYGKLKRKELKPMMATMTGKIKVKGDLALANKLKQFT